MSPLPGQRSFDDLGTPLHDVTFVVIDLETTGSRPDDDAITEIAAVRYRGGEKLGELSSLVHPGRAIPPRISVITGITESLVAPAPRIESVLPSLVEMCSGAVIVGHNVRFDMSFLRRALDRAGWPALDNPVVDTLALSRRIYAEEVPDHRLSTLARVLRLPHQPCHRALADADATADLLHELLGRAGRFGVVGLDDLLALPRMDNHPQAAKLRLTDRLPRRPGVYIFRDARGEALYVGKATDLRARVRSYFSSDRRRKVGALLREAESVDCEILPGPFAADIGELRLIRRLAPRYNRQHRRRKVCWVELTRHEPWPRVLIARRIKDNGGLYVGPFSSRKEAQLVIDAIHGASKIRRCSDRPSGTSPRPAACSAGQLGVSFCPCAAAVDAGRYATEVDRVARGLTDRPHLLLDPLIDQMHGFAADQRFEEAASIRSRAAALSAVVERSRRIDALRRSGTLDVVDGAGRARIVDGRLDRVEHDGVIVELPRPDDEDVGHLDESRLLCSLLDRSTARVEHVSHGYCLPYPPLPDLRPRQPDTTSGGRTDLHERAVTSARR